VDVGRGLRAVAAGTLWLGAVAVGLYGVASFVGGGAECARGSTTDCGSPNAGVLAVSIVVAVALGIAGGMLWKPRPKGREPRRPWDYPS
jgi:hypothetical protein